MLHTNPFDDDKLQEECGIFGIWDAIDAAAHCALGLHALQHRGQEAAGVVSYDGEAFHQHLAQGKVGDNFNQEKVIKALSGKAAIGHVRYSTSGGNSYSNIQPLFAEMSFGALALAHNGNLTNAVTLRRQLVARGSIFRTTMDTEAIVHLIATSSSNQVVDCLLDALKQVVGAYSMVVLTQEGLIGVRDPHGVRPLLLGQLGDKYVLASESCAFDIIGAKVVRDVEPGEMVIINDKGVTSMKPFAPVKQRFCIFEYVYFSRPDSHIEGKHVYAMRKAMGRELTKEKPVAADVIVPVPDSGVPAALGYAEASGVPFELGIIRNHYMGRTFIEPSDQVRHLGVKLKHNANRGVIEGKRVVLIDDSIVRGTTSKKIVEMVRDAGAKEVHMRISSPPTTHSCFYGVDTPERSKLLASHMNVEQMAEFIGADTLAFLSVDGMYRAVGELKRNPKSPQYCDACFTGEYPIDIVDGDEITSCNTIKHAKLA
jgi:amidophosphoribosyltransferase